MFEKFSSYISRSEKDTIVNILKWIKVIYIIYVILFFITIIRAVITDRVVLVTCLALAMPIIIFLYGMFQIAVQNGILQILTQELKPLDFLTVFEDLSLYRNGSKYVADKEKYLLGYSLSKVSTGDFEEALNYLDQLSECSFKGLQGQIRLAQSYYLQGLLSYLYNKELDLKAIDKLREMNSNSKLVQKTREHYLQILDSIERINSEQSENPFETLPYDTTLEKLSFYYLSVQFYLSRGQSDKAVTCFQEIANENSELFYVREAKRILQEEL